MPKKWPLATLAFELNIYRLDAQAPLPPTITSAKFCSWTRTANELSVVLSADIMLTDAICSPTWRAFYIDAELDHGLIGVMAEITTVLVQAQCSVFTISTFDTDYFLVPSSKWQEALAQLQMQGWTIT